MLPLWFAVASSTPAPNGVPKEIDALDGIQSKVGVDCTPVPVKLIVCGLPDALSAIERVAVRFPFPLGEKDTVTRQLLLAGSITPLQPSDEIEKSPALVPEMLAEILEREAFPLFVRVATPVVLPGIDWFPKFNCAGVRAATGMAPLPVSEMEKVVAGFP
jgi:hypothetical protein